MTNKAIVRCRCGHQVLAKEVLRTDLYERAMGREYVYVKYRCRRCKRLGEAFVAESRWDWSILEPAQNEMTDSERDQFLDTDAISAEEVLDFHRRLDEMTSWRDLEDDVSYSDEPGDNAAATTSDIASDASGTPTAASGASNEETSSIEIAQPPTPEQGFGAAPGDSADLI